MQMPNWPFLIIAFIKVSSFIPFPIAWITALATVPRLYRKFILFDFKFNRGTIASVVIQAIGSGTNEKTLMKATHPLIRLGQFGACTKLV